MRHADVTAPILASRGAQTKGRALGRQGCWDFVPDRSLMHPDNAPMPKLDRCPSTILVLQRARTWLPAALLMTSILTAQTTSRQQPHRQDLFPDGSRTVWLGDSITHACLYTRFLEDYARSRYPDRKLIFINAGVSADTTGDVLLRFEQDVSPWKPSRVFVCLGMNDGAFRAYDPVLFRIYQQSMRELLTRIHDLGADTRLLSPTPVDPHSRFRKSFQLPQIPADYLLVLARMRDWLQREARQNKLSFTDLYTPLRETQQLLQLENPGATLMPDGIHPNAPGHALMALRILDGAGEVRARWKIAFPRKGKPEIEGGQLQAVHRGDDGIRFRFRADSLPWVLPPEAMAAAHLDPAYRRINRSVLRIQGLPEGVHELRVDGSTLCQHTARQWARGVDIGLLVQHPNWLQSSRITEENAVRSTYIYKGITDLWIARHKVREISVNSQNGKVDKTTALEETNDEVAKITDKIRVLAERMSTSDAYLDRIRTPLFRNYEIRPMPAGK